MISSKHFSLRLIILNALSTPGLPVSAKSLNKYYITAAGYGVVHVSMSAYIYAMSLRPVISRRLDRLESDTGNLISDLKALPDVYLRQPPQPGYWSILEVANHIYLGEKLSMQYVEHKLTRPHTIARRMPDAWVRTIVLKWFLFSPIKFKSPPQINMRTGQPVLPLEDLVAVWKSQRDDLKRFLEVHEAAMKGKVPYKHPYAGMMSLNQMLIFFQDHLTHHRRQIRKIRQSLTLLGDVIESQ